METAGMVAIVVPPGVAPGSTISVSVPASAPHVAAVPPGAFHGTGGTGAVGNGGIPVAKMPAAQQVQQMQQVGQVPLPQGVGAAGPASANPAAAALSLGSPLDDQKPPDGRPY